MSYILEALRRAERERHLGQAPTVQSLAQAGALQGPGSRRRWLRPALAALMLVLLAASAWMLWPRAQPDRADEVPAPVPPPAARVAAPAVAAPLPAAVETAEAASVIDEEVPVETLDDVAPPFTPSVTDVAPAADAGTPPVPSPEPQAEIPAPPPAQTAPAPSPAPENALPRTLREMPAGYRAQFPGIALDVHVYDADPARRWIMVGGRRYNENETLAAGPRLVGIVPEGAIVEYGGERVLLPLNR